MLTCVGEDLEGPGGNGGGRRKEGLHFGDHHFTLAAGSTDVRGRPRKIRRGTFFGGGESIAAILDQMSGRHHREGDIFLKT